MTVKELCELMGRGEKTIRSGIVQGKFPFAVATKLKESNTSYDYKLFDGKIKEYITDTTLPLNLKVDDVAEMLGVDGQTVRVYLQQGLFSFGTAYKVNPDNAQFTYVFYPAKVEEFLIGKKQAERNYAELLANYKKTANYITN